MKAKARHCVNYNGVWHMTGEVFNIETDDAEEMRQYADVYNDEPAAEQPQTDEPVKRGRKRKTEPGND